jgi:hypothetical protein
MVSQQVFFRLHLLSSHAFETPHRPIIIHAKTLQGWVTEPRRRLLDWSGTFDDRVDRDWHGLYEQFGFINFRLQSAISTEQDASVVSKGLLEIFQDA